MSDTFRRWEEFRLRYRPLFRHIKREYPGFWGEVADLWRGHLEETVTTRGAVVRDFPHTTDAGTQTADSGDQARISLSPGARRLLAEIQAVADMTERPTTGESRHEEREARGRERSRSRRPTTTRGAAEQRGCWNCGDTGHRYATCPRAKARDFCYRCGTKGTTIRDCSQCRDAWREEGPYRPNKESRETKRRDG